MSKNSEYPDNETSYRGIKSTLSLCITIRYSTEIKTRYAIFHDTAPLNKRNNSQDFHNLFALGWPHGGNELEKVRMCNTRS